jgi:hypothetical protein
VDDGEEQMQAFQISKRGRDRHKVWHLGPRVQQHDVGGWVARANGALFNQFVVTS